MVDQPADRPLRVIRRWVGCWWRPWTWFRWLVAREYPGGVYHLRTPRWAKPTEPPKRGRSRRWPIYERDELGRAWRADQPTNNTEEGQE